MDADIIRAYVWEEIISLGFSPSDIDEKKKWCRIYARSTQSFWESSSYIPEPKRVDKHGIKIDIKTDLNLACDFYSENLTRGSFRVGFSFASLGKQDSDWHHDYDVQYYAFPNSIFLSAHGQRKDALKKMNLKHVENVVDSLIFHPTPHQHIISPIDVHEIRIGGGIINPFLYLFCLKIQLCPKPEKVKQEKVRITKLFHDKIREKDRNRQLITCNELLQHS